MSIQKDDGTRLMDYNGYAPGFISRSSDYIEMEIDAETGKILNWKSEQVQKFIDNHGKEDENIEEDDPDSETWHPGHSDNYGDS